MTTNPIYSLPPTFRQTKKKIQPAANANTVQPTIDPILQDSVGTYPYPPPSAYPDACPAPASTDYPSYYDSVYAPPPPSWGPDGAPLAERSHVRFI